MAAMRHGLHAWKGWKEIKSSEILCTAVTGRVFSSPHYFTTEAKKTKATFGSDAKMHQMDAVSSRQHTPGLQQRVYFVSTPTPPPSTSLPQRCWFPYCCISIFTHTRKYKHTHKPKHTLVQIKTLWQSWEVATISQMTERSSAWPHQKSVCMCV